MSEISGPQTGNSYDKVFPFEILVKMCFVSQLKPGTIGKDLEGFHSRLDKSAPGAAEVRIVTMSPGHSKAHIKLLLWANNHLMNSGDKKST